MPSQNCNCQKNKFICRRQTFQKIYLIRLDIIRFANWFHILEGISLLLIFSSLNASSETAQKKINTSEEYEDTKGAIRIRKSKKIKHNGKKNNI